MEHVKSQIIDKAIVLVMCLPCLLVTAVTTEEVVGLLLALAITFLHDSLPLEPSRRDLLPLAYSLSTVFLPDFVFFLGLAAYDLMQGDKIWMRAVWPVGILAALAWGVDNMTVAWCTIVCAAACVLSWRSGKTEATEKDMLHLRDERQETVMALAARNKDLQERQDYEVRLATLEERSRIAREIHDNVGHLITRAIMQTEAMKVVHADDPKTVEDFEQLGETLHTAMDTIRRSVHDLHDDSLDLEGQLRATLENCSIPQTHLEFKAAEVDANVGYCFLAVTREAVSNTVRHSDATRIDVSILETPGFYQLVVQDNGTKKPTMARTGMGLETMDARARTLGGIMRTSWKDGFRVLVTIPKKTGRDEEHPWPSA